MRWKQQLRKSATGTLRATAPGLPTAATVSIYSPEGATLVSAAAATLDLTPTTVSTWTSTAPRYAVLTTVTGVAAGNEYWIVNPDGRTQTVRVVGVNTSTKTVQFADEPEFPIVATAAFQSRGASYSVSSSVLTDYGQGYRAEWTWTIGGAARVTEEVFDVVHSPAVCPATGAGFRRANPWMGEKFDQISDAHNWDDLVAQAFIMCLYELEAVVIDKQHDLANAIVDWSQWEPVVYARLLADHAESLIPPDWAAYPQDYASRAWAKYKTAFEAVSRNLRYDDGEQTRATPGLRRRGGFLVP